MGPLYKWPKIHGVPGWQRAPTDRGPHIWYLPLRTGDLEPPQVGLLMLVGQPKVLKGWCFWWPLQPESHNKTPCQLEYYEMPVVGTFTAGLEDWDVCIPVSITRNELGLHVYLIMETLFSPIERSRNRKRWKPTAKAPDNRWLPGR